MKPAMKILPICLYHQDDRLTPAGWLRICAHPDSPQVDQAVPRAICEACPLRKSRPTKELWDRIQAAKPKPPEPAPEPAPTPPGPGPVRPDLVAIETSLPPAKEGRDRKLRFESDGTIVYEKDGWEPPREIEGYQRDPENAWRFLPLWNICALRHQIAVRYANCGCIGIITRCNNPQCSVFMQRVSHNQCNQCDKRKV
jgi:hypothetical protein